MPYLIASRAAGARTSAKLRRDGTHVDAASGRTVGHAEIKSATPHHARRRAPRRWAPSARRHLGRPPPVGPDGVRPRTWTRSSKAKAVKQAGATSQRPLQDQFYGDRSGTITDPFGHTWYVATHVEDVSPDELGKREAMHKKEGAGSAKA